MKRKRLLAGLYTWFIIFLGLMVMTLVIMKHGFVWKPVLFLPAILSVFSEKWVIRMPRGETFTLSFVFVLLTLLLSGTMEAMEIILIGSFFGYGVWGGRPLPRLLFYSSHYVLASALAGAGFSLVSETLPPWFLESFHLPAVLVYVLIYALVSQTLIGLHNRLVLGIPETMLSSKEQAAELPWLPKTDFLIAFLLMPLPLLTYYLYQNRDFYALILVLIPLFAVLIAFRSYINIDTAYDEVSTLYKISQKFVAALSQEEMVQVVAQGIAHSLRQLVSYEACFIYSLDEENNRFPLVHIEGEMSAPPEATPGKGPLGQAVVRGQVEPIQLESGSELPWPGGSYLILAPLRTESTTVGLVVLLKEKKPFSAESYRLMNILASQAGVVLRNAQLYEQTQREAQTDPMLGLMNKQAFRLRARSELDKARRNGISVAIILTDVDDFKKINTLYGHPGGDKVLRGLAEVLYKTVRDRGIVGRYGGEEMVILLPDADAEKAREVAEEVRLAVANHRFPIDDSVEAQATISVGVAIFPQDALTVEDLIDRADQAAYVAKKAGKNRVCLYGERTARPGHEKFLSEMDWRMKL
ncbi:MAG: sensor domain-containing diguanylate cyclase [Anaerolineae bacterium]